MIKTSDSLVNFTKSFQAFQNEVESVTRNAKNPQFASKKYADISAIIEEIKEPLFNNNLSFVQFPGTNENGALTMTTRIMHNSGEYMESTFSMTPTQNTPQGVGSCITYMRRYSLSSILGLSTEDDDANAASAPVAKATYTPPVARPTPKYETDSSPKGEGAQQAKAVAEAMDSETAEFVSKLAAKINDTDPSEFESLLAKIKKSPKYTDRQKEEAQKLVTTAKYNLAV